MVVKKKNNQKKEKYVRVCPKCKSINIKQDKSTLQQTGALPTMYICNKCGHSGYTFPEVKLSELKKFEVEVDAEHLRDNKKDKTELIDTSYGKFEVRLWWKIVSPIMILLGVFLLFFEPISGIISLILGLITFYITYFKKRKLRDE